MVKKEGKTLVLLDTHAIIHRAYHALPDFTSAKGEPTGALYGLTTMLLKIIRELSPDYIAACYDLPKPTFRHKVYKDYKKGRAKAEDDLIAQIKRSYEIFKAFSIPVFESAGFEADDIIGTIVSHVKKEKDLSIIIASGDMDTLQLVDGKRVRVFTLKKGINDTILYDEEAVQERFGFRPELLPDYKGIRGDPSDNIVGVKGIGEKGGAELIKEFGTLETIFKTLKKDRSIFIKKGFKERIVKLLEEHKEEAFFSKVLAQIRVDAPISFSLEETKWDNDLNKEKIIELFGELGFRSLVARLSNGNSSEKKENSAEKEIIDEKELEKVKIAVWLLDSALTNPSQEDILHFAKKKKFFEAKEYIFEKLKKEKLEKLFTEIEEPLTPILERAEKHGIKIDKEYLLLLSKKFHEKLSTLEKEIWKLAGEEFNINSPKQMGEVLFEKMKLGGNKIKKTTGGAKSTRQSVLEEMKEGNPIIEEILAYREIQKLLSTYVDNIPEMLDEKERLHTHFVQTGTTTGRIASQNPNLQNIPVHGEYGETIRKMFMADEGFKLLAFDYSQVELRVAALLSKDEKLTEILRSGHDVHSATGSLIFKVPMEKVTKDMRRIAKVINFGIIYGMGVNALRQNLGTTRAEAHTFYENYFETFSGLAKYLERLKKEAKERGYTETYFGRRRYFPGLRSHIPYIVAMEERQALNAPIQGTSADIIKKAMILADARLKKEELENAFLLLQIHDELIFEVKEEDVPRAAKIIKEEMEIAISAEIPFIVTVHVGNNWGEMQKLHI
jgi:DNA polymerase-1